MPKTASKPNIPEVAIPSATVIEEEDDLNYILPEYRVNARRRSQDEIERIKKYHQENYKKFSIILQMENENQLDTKEDEF